MTTDPKWSEYDFTKIPFDDLVSVGQRTLLYRDIFTVSWLLGLSVIIVVRTAGHMRVATLKITGLPRSA
jgi:hypothetical protein